MKKIICLTVLILGISSLCFADSYVDDYYRRNGTYVQPYHRSNSDDNFDNNYSSRGNTNPYTGEIGYKKDDYRRSSGLDNLGGYGDGLGSLGRIPKFKIGD